MEIQKLKYFYTVAQFQHMTKAAEHIKIAQPALSQAIKSLENELGVALFSKNGRNIVLTECGEYLKNRLDSILPEIDGLADEMAQLKSRVNKTVKLNILAASSFVVSAIVEFRKKHPDVIFDFEQSALNQGSDMVIKTNGFGNESKKKCIKRCVKEERIYLAVPKNSDYAKYDSIDLKQVSEEGFVMLSSSRLFGIICEKFCNAASFYPKIMFESDSPSAVQNIISTGTGVAFWPEYSWGKVNNENVKLLSISEPVCVRELIFELFEQSSKSLYAEEFFDFLTEYILKV